MPTNADALELDALAHDATRAFLLATSDAHSIRAARGDVDDAQRARASTTRDAPAVDVVGESPTERSMAIPATGARAGVVAVSPLPLLHLTFVSTRHRDVGDDGSERSLLRVLLV